MMFALSGLPQSKEKGKKTKLMKIKCAQHYGLTCESEMYLLYQWSSIMIFVNAFNMIMNLSYKEELSLYLSSYPDQWQKLLVAPGVAVPP